MVGSFSTHARRSGGSGVVWARCAISRASLGSGSSGAGTAPFLVLAVGARDHRSKGQEWGAYTVDEAALRHGAGVQRETTEGSEAYARFPPSKLTRYHDGWLPD